MSTKYRKWVEQLSCSTAAPSNPVIVPGDAVNLGVTAIPGGGGSIRVEFSLNPKEDVEAGTATWVAWEEGNVGTPTSRALVGTITAIRGVATTANGTLQVAGYRS